MKTWDDVLPKEVLEVIKKLSGDVVTPDTWEEHIREIEKLIPTDRLLFILYQIRLKAEIERLRKITAYERLRRRKGK